MNKNQKNKLLCIIFIFFVTSFQCYAESFIKKNTYNLNNNQNIKISNTTYMRIKGYLNGNFYSENLNKKLYQISGIYFSISQDGNYSTTSFCDADDFSLCAEQMLAYQTLKKCERISKQKCFLIFRGKTFLPLITNNIDIKKIFTIVNNSNGKHYDIYGKTLEEYHDPKD